MMPRASTRSWSRCGTAPRSGVRHRVHTITQEDVTVATPATVSCSRRPGLHRRGAPEAI
jgi:hypothetical protein